MWTLWKCSLHKTSFLYPKAVNQREQILYLPELEGGGNDQIAILDRLKVWRRVIRMLGGCPYLHRWHHAQKTFVQVALKSFVIHCFIAGVSLWCLDSCFHYGAPRGKGQLPDMEYVRSTFLLGDWILVDWKVVTLGKMAQGINCVCVRV